MLIGITGTHGTGKTTFLYKLAHDLKIRHSTKSLGIISEVARSCPLPIFSAKSEASERAQMWILASLIREEISKAAKFDIVISDRTVFDVIAYTMEVDQDLAAEMLGLVQRIHYDQVYFIRPFGEEWMTNDGQRSVDSGLRQRVDRNLVSILNSQDINVKEIKIKRMN